MSVLTIKEANKTSRLIKVAGKKLDERIHQVAVSGLAHFMLSGDNTVLTNLVKAMPKSARGNALKFWISQHTQNKLKWDKSAHAKTGGYKGKKPELAAWEQTAIMLVADSAPFLMKEETEAKEWNPNASVLNLVKKLNAYKKEHNLQLPEETKAALVRVIA